MRRSSRPATGERSPGCIARSTALAWALGLAACAPGTTSVTRASHELSPVHACAIGYDMARTIHQSIALRETVVIAPARRNDCEDHVLRYLRLAGFAVDDSGQTSSRPAFDVEVIDVTDGAATVVATVAGNLRVARQYRLAETGVYAASAPSIVELPSQYRRKPSAKPTRSEER